MIFTFNGNINPQPTTVPNTPTPQPTNTPNQTATPAPTPTASPTSAPTLAPTPTPTPSIAGSSRSNPAPKGTSLTIQFDWIGKIYNAKITLLETKRGTEAWTRIREANMFNDAPDQGYEYILVKIRFEYLSGPTADTKYDVSPVFFDAVSSSGVEYAYKSNVPPIPSLSTSLYPGASHEGWACYQVATNDTKPLLAFGTNYDGTGGIWFKLY